MLFIKVYQQLRFEIEISINVIWDNILKELMNDNGYIIFKELDAVHKEMGENNKFDYITCF